MPLELFRSLQVAQPIASNQLKIKYYKLKTYMHVHVNINKKLT